MGAGNLDILGRAKVGFLALSFCLLFVLVILPNVSAGDVHRKELQYIIEGEYSIIEGVVFDAETGTPVGGADVKGEINPEGLCIDVIVDASGHFFVEIMEDGDHDFILKVCAPGYEPVTVAGSIKHGEHKNLRIPVNYDPFDLQLSESSGSLTRGYRESSYLISRLIPFKAQRTVQVLDSKGQPVFDTIEERVLTGYTWEQLVIGYRIEYYTFKVPTLVPKYRTERYVSSWVKARVGRLLVFTPIFSMRQVFDGYILKYVAQTTTRLVPYEHWIVKTSTTPDFYADIRTKTLRDDVRNPRAIYTTTIRQVPRTRVETYIAYREYSYSGTVSSFLPWENKQVQVKAIPKNGYTNSANFSVSSITGATASLGRTSLNLAVETSTTLNVAPERASSQVIVIKAHDSKGRFIESRNYDFSSVESLPSGSSSDLYIGTKRLSSVNVETKVKSTTDLVAIKTNTPVVSPVIDFKPGIGAAYVSHIYHGLPVKDEMVYQFGDGIPLKDWPLLTTREKIKDPEGGSEIYIP